MNISEKERLSYIQGLDFLNTSIHPQQLVGANISNLNVPLMTRAINQNSQQCQGGEWRRETVTVPNKAAQ